MLWTGLVGGDEGEVDLVASGRRECNLRLLGLLLDPLQRVWLTAEVDTVVAIELVHDPVDDGVVPVVAAELRVAVGGHDLEDTVADVEDGDVEGAAAEVVDSDLLVRLLVEPVGERGSRRLVDDPLHLEAGDLACSLGRVALRVVEVGRHGDDCLGDLFTQAGLGVRLEFAQDHRRDLLWAVDLLFSTGLDLNVGVAIAGFHDLVRCLLIRRSQLGELAADQTLR